VTFSSASSPRGCSHPLSHSESAITRTRFFSQLMPCLRRGPSLMLVPRAFNLFEAS
jgi:hypothetical protein